MSTHKNCAVSTRAASGSNPASARAEKSELRREPWAPGGDLRRFRGCSSGCLIRRDVRGCLCGSLVLRRCAIFFEFLPRLGNVAVVELLPGIDRHRRGLVLGFDALPLMM